MLFWQVYDFFVNEIILDFLIRLPVEVLENLIHLTRFPILARHTLQYGLGHGPGPLEKTTLESLEKLDST